MTERQQSEPAPGQLEAERADVEAAAREAAAIGGVAADRYLGLRPVEGPS